MQLSKLKTAIKNNEGTTLRIINKKINKEDLPHELFLTQQQTTKLRNKIENNMSADIKLSRTQIRKMDQFGGFLGRLLGRFLIKPATKILPKLIKPAISVGKNISAPLGLSAAVSATDAAIQKKIYGSGITTLVISNEELNDIMKIIQALEDQNILLKGVGKKIKNDINIQKGGALGMLLGTLGASLLGKV